MPVPALAQQPVKPESSEKDPRRHRLAGSAETDQYPSQGQRVGGHSWGSACWHECVLCGAPLYPVSAEVGDFPIGR